MTTTLFFYWLLFIIGLLFWSFWSVISSRLAEFWFDDMLGCETTKKWEKESRQKKRKTAIQGILRGRSHCPQCHHTLHAKDLIPIVSYLSTGGRCRYCKKSIPSTYIRWEIWCGFLFAILWGILANTTGTSAAIVVLWLALIRTWYLLLVHDIRTMHLHEPLWLLTLLLSIVFLFTLPGGVLSSDSYSYLQGGRYYALVFGVVFLIFFFGFYWFARRYVRMRFWKDEEWFGSGDVRIAPLLGIQFGAREYFLQAPYILAGEGFSRAIAIQHMSYYIMLAGVLCLVYAGIQKLINAKTSVRELPFFTGMISTVWVLMVLTHFWVL